MFIFNRVVLLQINKITFEKSGNPEKNHISQNPAKILTEIFNSEFLSWFFLDRPWRKYYLKISRKIQVNCYVKYEILDG